MSNKSPKYAIRALLIAIPIIAALLWTTPAFLSGRTENHPAKASDAAKPNRLTGNVAPTAKANLNLLPAPVPAPTVGPGIAPTGDPGTPGGFGIEGDLKADFPGTDQSTDWLPGPAPSGSPRGDYLLNVDGSVRTVFPAIGNGNITRHFTDGVDKLDKEIFQSTGDKYNDNPTTWDWAVGTPPSKNDINHALLHQSIDAITGDTWIVVAGDQGSSTGDRYIDFELYQKPVTKTFVTPTSGKFSSGAPAATGGRTVGDILLTIQLSQGGAAAQFFVYSWQPSAASPLGYDYLAEPAAAGNVYIAANTGGIVDVAYGAFGKTTYGVNTFAEAAVNLNKLIGSFGANPCIGIKTLFIKTKTSSSPSAQLKDFIEPIQLEFGSAPSSTITAADVCANSTANIASVTDAGPGSTYSWTITNGTIEGSNTTNQITYTAGSSGTVDLSVTVTNKAGCASTTNPTKSVAISPSPTAFSVTGGGAYCTGGTGLVVGLSGSQTGVNYQLVRDPNINVGSPVAGTGSAISFGNQTASGTYTVAATNASAPNCPNSMTGSAIISVTPLPTVFSVTGGGAYCSGGPGVAVGLNGSQTGVSYQLVKAGANVGSAVAGTGGAISFGNQTEAGTYTVVADQSSSCPRDMGGSALISINSLPTVFSVNGGGTYCEGGAGKAVGLNGSQTGVNYQLKLGASNVGSPVAGTGLAISFGLKTAAGTYTVVATGTTTPACSSDMGGSAAVVVEANPTTFDVTGGGTYCAGGSGVVVGLSGSQSGVKYQLKLGASNVGSPVSGSGSAISFGLRTDAGTYTVVATNDTSSACATTMNGNAVVVVEPNPTAFNVTGGGTYCAGGLGVAVGLSGSQSGVNYQLKLGGSTVGSPVVGTGSAISFGLHTDAGTYTVTAANNTSSACPGNMNGSAVIVVEANPTAFGVTGGGSYCAGGLGVAVGLSSSQSGVNYQLKLGGSTVGSPVAGTGSAITFGLQTAAGTYTVVASNNTTSACLTNMSGDGVIVLEQEPTAFTVTGGGAYCEGGVGKAIGLNGSQNAVNYQLVRDGVTSVGALVAGTGSAISFGNQTVAGTYTVLATNNTANGCSRSMSGSALISIDQLPSVILALNQTCDEQDGTEVVQLVAAPAPGGNYSYSWSGPDGPVLDSQGQAIIEPAITPSKPGTYTVLVTNTATGCSVSGSFKLCFTGSQLVSQATPFAPLTDGTTNQSSTAKAKSEPAGFRSYVARLFSMFG